MAARQRAMELISRKDAAETELSAQFSILSTNQSTMNTPLVDAEGFPRSDIDVWAVRHARVRIIELKNDIKSLVDQIATALQNVAQDDASSSNPTNASDQPKLTNGDGHVNDSDGEPSDSSVPFARVDGVAPGSPAAEAVNTFPLLNV